MSYEIEYSKHAFFIPAPTFEKAFFTYVKTASNNVDPRTPNPRLFKAGYAYEVIGEACRVGASVESGCWKPRNRWSSPEAYIKSWRLKLKEARPFEEFVREHPCAEIEIAVVKDAFQTYLDTPPANVNPAGWTKERIQELIGQAVKEDRPFFNEKLLLFKINLRTYQDVKNAAELTALIKDVGLLYWQALRDC
ncbi:MAG: hypothetical protein IMZ61_11570 [Planctomycetes bacterium]|nr:hypothetical protein [Planctomycetota bacterium]